MNIQFENYKNKHYNKKNKKLDWFEKLDKINSSIHFKYNNLENKKNDISKRQFYLSLIESSTDEKRFKRIKSEFERNFLNNNEKNKTIVNNTIFTDGNKNKNKNNNLFLHLNIYNYKKDEQNTFISQNEKDSLKVILKRFENKYKRRESIKHIHNKIYANNAFNLSQTNLKLLSSLSNKRKKLNYFNRNNFFKYNLNDKLYNILNIANVDEEEFKKTRNKIFSSISNQENPFITTFNKYKKEKEFENNAEITEEELTKKLEQRNQQIMNEIKDAENSFKKKKEDINSDVNDNNEIKEKELNLIQLDNELNNDEENNENNIINNENDIKNDIQEDMNHLEEYKKNIINKNKNKKYKLTEKKRIQIMLKDKIFDENKCYDDKVINKIILKGKKNVFSVTKNKIYNSYLNKIKDFKEKKRKEEEIIEKEKQLKKLEKEKNEY